MKTQSELAIFNWLRDSFKCFVMLFSIEFWLTSVSPSGHWYFCTSTWGLMYMVSVKRSVAPGFAYFHNIVIITIECVSTIMMLIQWYLTHSMPLQGHYVNCFLLKQERATKWIRAAFEKAMQFPMNWAALLGSLTPKCSHFISVPMAFLTGKDRQANLGSEQR